MLVKSFYNNTVYFSLETPCLLIQVISGLIAVQDESGLLFALAILNNSTPTAE